MRKGAIREVQPLLFDPDAYKGQSEQLTLENYGLSQEQLLEYAKVTSKIRAELDRRAAGLAEESKDPEQPAIKDLKRGPAKPKQPRRPRPEMPSRYEHNPAHPRRKRRSMRQLSAEERLKIVRLAA